MQNRCRIDAALQKWFKNNEYGSQVSLPAASAILRMR